MTTTCDKCGHAVTPLGLSEREFGVLQLMAEGRSNLGIARGFWISEGTVEKHVRSILTKLQIPDDKHDHRRVLAVLALLQYRAGLVEADAMQLDGTEVGS